MEERNIARVCPLALGVSGGLLWAFAVFVFAFAPADINKEIISFIGQFYKGYEAGFAGACIGAIWGFLDAGIGLALLAVLYNFIVGKMVDCHKKNCCLTRKCKK